jgi:hypothetical protein
VTFGNIALIPKPPKQHLVSFLQTQKRQGNCRHYEILKQALLTAYELCSEVYKKRSRVVSQNTSEIYADIAFKLQNAFERRWMRIIDAYDDFKLMRQAHDGAVL